MFELPTLLQLLLYWITSLSNNDDNFTTVDDKEQKLSQKVLDELENIDDECDQHDIAFVKIDDDKEAEEWGIDEIPTIVSTFRENHNKHINIW